MAVATSVLVVDDDPSFARTLAILLEDEGGYRVEVAHSGPEALRTVERNAGVRLVLSDLAMPGMDGLELLRHLVERWPHLPVVIMTAHSSIPSAVEAIRLGALQYLTKPVEPDELLVQVARALERQRLDQQHRQLCERLGDPFLFDRLVGSSPAALELRALIERLAEVDSTVLVRGETGTGKELVARLLHACGPRSEGPFMVVNCTAIPGELLESELYGHEKGAFTGAAAARAGRIEQADGGTLLLDEIGDMPLALQPKLLRFLQDRRVQRVGSSQERAVDVRVVAATHRDLERAMAAGEFRPDLFHRLATIPVRVPPLRERREDLPELCDHLLAKVARRIGRPLPRLEPMSLQQLASLPFPGNVRELENLLERALVLSDVGSDGILRLIGVPPASPGSSAPVGWAVPLEGGHAWLQQRYREAERDLVERAVRAWPDISNTEIAERLGTQRRVLERRLKEYGLTKG